MRPTVVLSTAAALVFMFWVPNATAEVIYLCKRYSGGLFWSTLACSQQQATMEKFYDVPGSLSFQERVAQAERMRSTPAREAPQGSGPAGIQSTPVPGSELECDQHRRRVKDLESMRHQVRPEMSLDAIAAELNFRRNRVSQLRCR